MKSKMDSGTAMGVIVSQLDRKKKKFFSFDRVEEAMVAVIWNSGNGEGKARFHIRAHTAAKMAVFMQDEHKLAKKEHAREGYLLLLERLELVATQKVFKFDPDGSWLTKTYPRMAAMLGTPDKIFEAQAEIEAAEMPEKRRAAAKAKAKAAA